MDLPIILTYRCNAHCSMCNAWKNPSLPEEEVTLETLMKLPSGLDVISLTGGEPTLRNDLEAVVDGLYGKARTFEISSNGLLAEKLLTIIRRHPDIKIRISLEGVEETNNRVRGEKNGFQKKVACLLALKEAGGTDLGIGVTIQDENASQLGDLFEFAEKYGFELATSTIHNGFQFYKSDNSLYDRREVAGHIAGLIRRQLQTSRPKNWFRAYVNLGIMARVLGQDRLLPCLAGREFVFVDPWADVFVCNVRPDLKVGNLAVQSWEEVMTGKPMQEALRQAAACQQNCWMVGSAKTAMRNPRFKMLPRSKPLFWVIENKLRVTLGKDIRDDGYFTRPLPSGTPPVVRREYYLEQTTPRRIQHKDEPHYADVGEIENR